MKYDKARVMKLAWIWAKQDLWSARADKSKLREYFIAALKRAWVDVKNTTDRQTPVKTDRTKEQVMYDIWAFECKDTIRGNDWKILNKLRQELVYAK
jgi:hypothetical protein